MAVLTPRELMCRDCEAEGLQVPATRFFKAHWNFRYNIPICEKHSDDDLWMYDHMRYVPFKIVPLHLRLQGLFERWPCLYLLPEGAVVVHPDARIYGEPEWASGRK